MRKVCRDVDQWQVGWAGAEDEADLLELFRESFGHEMSLAQWRWKYAGANPLGSMVRVEGKPIAFYGGMPRALRLCGQQVKAVQIGDVMVCPEYRRILTRRGPFFWAASRFSEHMVGPGKPYHCTYGFPSQRHYRLGEHLGLYGCVGEMLQASWSPLPGGVPKALTARPLDEAGLAKVGPLWEAMADDLRDKAVLERDFDHLRHRYLRSPLAAYDLLLVKRRFFGTPLGLLVLRQHGAGDLELLDMVAPLRHWPTLLEVARRIAGERGLPRLFGWLTAPVAVHLGEGLTSLDQLEIPLGEIVWKQPADMLSTSGLWWLMGGDTDSR